MILPFRSESTEAMAGRLLANRQDVDSGDGVGYLLLRQSVSAPEQHCVSITDIYQLREDLNTRTGRILSVI